VFSNPDIGYGALSLFFMQDRNIYHVVVRTKYGILILPIMNLMCFEDKSIVNEAIRAYLEAPSVFPRLPVIRPAIQDISVAIARDAQQVPADKLVPALKNIDLMYDVRRKLMKKFLTDTLLVNVVSVTDIRRDKLWKHILPTFEIVAEDFLESNAFDSTMLKELSNLN
jgi:hypothetical protein